VLNAFRNGRKHVSLGFSSSGKKINFSSVKMRRGEIAKVASEIGMD
jgi:hypothetical protein